MKKRILAYGRLNDDQLAQLGQDFEVQTFPDLASADDPAFRSALPDAHGLIGASVAITEALEMGRIRAAGLDVLEQEPLSPESPLPHMTNVVALPHIGSAIHETRNAMAQRAVDKLILALKGERPISLVNEAAWRSV